MKTLLIDNYDSFTYNLFQLLAEVNGEDPIVVRNDEAGWADLAGLGCDNIVISPGPGRPDRERDFGVCPEVIRRSTVPLLGVCLGHQGLGTAFGARVARAPEAVHGRLSTIHHDGSPFFDGIPSKFQAVRYHSLCVEQPLPEPLKPLAWTSDGVLMALEHHQRPLWGVQFHPESVCAEHGRRLLTNFRDLSEQARQRTPARRTDTAARVGDDTAARQRGDGDTPERADTQRGRSPRVRAGVSPSPLLPHVPVAPSQQLAVERLDRWVDPELVFTELYGENENAFWLDSSRVDERARFSFMGDDSGPLAAVITYDVEAGEVRIERGGAVELRRESIFDYLDRELERLRVAAPELPFDFDCGFVGWFGYELKAECGGDAAHASPLPDAAFLFADRALAFDHMEGHIYLLCLSEAGGSSEEGSSEAESEDWIAATSDRLASLAESPPGGALRPPAEAPGSGMGRETPDGEPGIGDGGGFRLRRPRERYLEEIAECRRLLAEGETYEVCLTNRVEAEVSADPLSLYRALRRINPAPFSSFLRFGETAVLSSSPERFLAVDRDRRVEAKPIKGTCRRGRTRAEDARLAEGLRGDEKSRAENLMIVDLLRNDLGAVCEVGSVTVPGLIEVESYETVHQLVSTVRGRLREGLRPPDCIRACFPPGSMTGAPKRRTMRIIDELEGGARGVYSGAIGYLGLGGGCDLSVAIRTIVLDGEAATIGAGGAIVTQSDPEEEYGEMLLKASAPMRAVDPGADPAIALRPTAGTGSLLRSPA